MPAADFHDKPFDEGTLTKLQIFELYAREWLPVFLSRKDGRCTEVHVFDFFAGPGTDADGTEGSPLRLLRKLQEAQRDPKRYPGWSTYYLAPFSIKKDVNIYGVIFGSAHPLGMDKFLQVAWKKDEVNGEANFDIGRDNVMPDQPKLDFEIFGPTKLIAFERELETGLRGGAFTNEVDVIRACFRHGVKRQHATAVLSRLKKEGVIGLDFRVPDIDRLRAPRPIRLMR